jgi:hypothetical protein
LSPPASGSILSTIVGLDQVAQLVTDLRREVGQSGRRSEPKPRMKGIDLGPIIVSVSQNR